MADAAVVRAHPVDRDAGASPRDAAAASTPTFPHASTEQDTPCAGESHVTLARGWRLQGFVPGPALREIYPIRRRRLVALTARRVCTSDDNGDHWTERFALESAQSMIGVQRVDRRGTLLAVGSTRDASDATRITQLALSRDADAESWSPIALPPATSPIRAAFTDNVGRLFAATNTQLYVSEDLGAHWRAPRALPGREATELAACGPTLIAHARAEIEWFYHRSFDHGATWRPLRLGVLGLEGDRSIARCITERGGIEAGRPPLPTSWSWDGGLRWIPSPYDADAQRVARVLSDGSSHPELGEAPHCASGPGRMIECVDPGRSRLLTDRGVVRSEVYAPSRCPHVRQIDARRTLAFGAGCGLFGSPDRGGRWRMHSQSLAGPSAAIYADGRGGFVSDDVAWRLDGGVWWTFDGGEHWQPSTSRQARLLDRGVFVDARNGVFATNNGWVVSTHDGGNTFTFVLRGEVERIASTRRAVIVTTTQSVRVSPDGGRSWLAAGAAAPSTPIDRTVEIVGNRRSIAIAPGEPVAQEAGRVTMGDGEGASIASGLPPGYHLLAAHATRGHVDRILLEGGAVLAHD